MKTVRPKPLKIAARKSKSRAIGPLINNTRSFKLACKGLKLRSIILYKDKNGSFCVKP